MSLIRRVPGRRAPAKTPKLIAHRHHVTENLLGYYVQSDQCGGQPWLYHWTKTAKLSDVRQHGLRGGSGECLGRGHPVTMARCVGRVFFSTDVYKWGPCDEDPTGWDVLRVATDSIDCVYDGGDWINPDGWYDGRPADCYTQDAIPPELLEILVGSRWEKLA